MHQDKAPCFKLRVQIRRSVPFERTQDFHLGVNNSGWRTSHLMCGNLTRAEAVMAIDPVCGMDVNESNPPAKTNYDGKTYYFCSEECKQDFEEDPEDFISSAA